MSRGWLALPIALAACAAAPTRVAKPAPPPPVARDAGVADMTPVAGAELPSLDDLAERGEPLAMHEVKRASDVKAPLAVDAAGADTCFRAVVAASHPTRSWFEDAGNVIRGEVAERTGTGLVPPRGPVCAKKGEELRLVVMAPNAGTTTRAVIFASP